VTIRSDFGIVSGPYGGVRVGIVESWGPDSEGVAMVTLHETFEPDQGMTPRQARGLASLLREAADEAERSDRVRKGGK
jgi:hypothetical protein